MAAAALSDADLLAALREHPRLRERIASMIGIVLDGEGAPKEADAAEDLVFGEVRHLGRDVLQGWAESRIAAAGRETGGEPGVRRMGKKNSAGTASSAK